MSRRRDWLAAIYLLTTYRPRGRAPERLQARPDGTLPAGRRARRVLLTVFVLGGLAALVGAVAEWLAGRGPVLLVAQVMIMLVWAFTGLRWWRVAERWQFTAEAWRMAAPGSFVACECSGFVEATS